MKNKPHTTLNIKYNIDAKLNTEITPSKETEGIAANSITDAVNGAGDEVRMAGRKGKKTPERIEVLSGDKMALPFYGTLPELVFFSYCN